ncbi:MAG: hypothetical protein HLX46_13255, partial [Corynebacterium sp.]
GVGGKFLKSIGGFLAFGNAFGFGLDDESSSLNLGGGITPIDISSIRVTRSNIGVLTTLLVGFPFLPRNLVFTLIGRSFKFTGPYDNISILCFQVRERCS